MNCSPKQATGHRWGRSAVDTTYCLRGCGAILRLDESEPWATADSAYAHKLSTMGYGSDPLPNGNGGYPLTGDADETAAPKFKVGDRVTALNSPKNEVGTISRITDIATTVEWEDGSTSSHSYTHIFQHAPNPHSHLRPYHPLVNKVNEFLTTTLPNVKLRANGVSQGEAAASEATCTCNTLLNGHLHGCPYPLRGGKE